MKRWTIGLLVAMCFLADEASAEVTQLSVVAIGEAAVEITARDGEVVRGRIVGHDSTRFVVLTEDGVARELSYGDVERLRVPTAGREPVVNEEGASVGSSAGARARADEPQTAQFDGAGDDGADEVADTLTPTLGRESGYLGGVASASVADSGQRVPGPYSNSLGVPYARGFDPEVVTTLVARGRRQRIWGGVLLGMGSLGMISQVTSMVQREGYGGTVYEDDVAALVMTSAMMVGGVPLILAGRKKHAAAAAYQRQFLMTPTAARGGGGVQLNARF